MRPARAVRTAELPAELIHAWCRGDAQAGERVLRGCRDTVRAYLVRRAADQLDDLVQDTLIAITRRRDAAARAGSFRGYLLTTARRKLIDAARGHTHAGLPAEPPDPCSEPGRALLQYEAAGALRDALDTLPRGLAVVLALYYLDERTAAEIATSLGIPEGTVRTRVRRGIQRVRAHLGASAAPEPLGCGLDEWAAAVRRPAPRR
jgi:RNA polymerase sigma factor (sigma-70 family)